MSEFDDILPPEAAAASVATIDDEYRWVVDAMHRALREQTRTRWQLFGKVALHTAGALVTIAVLGLCSRGIYEAGQRDVRQSAEYMNGVSLTGMPVDKMICLEKFQHGETFWFPASNKGACSQDETTFTIRGSDIVTFTCDTRSGCR